MYMNFFICYYGRTFLHSEGRTRQLPPSPIPHRLFPPWTTLPMDYSPHGLHPKDYSPWTTPHELLPTLTTLYRLPVVFHALYHVPDGVRRSSRSARIHPGSAGQMHAHANTRRRRRRRVRRSRAARSSHQLQAGVVGQTSKANGQRHVQRGALQRRSIYRIYTPLII